MSSLLYCPPGCGFASFGKEKLPLKDTVKSPALLRQENGRFEASLAKETPISQSS